MSVIEDVFNHLKVENEGALIAYIMAGDPHPKYTSKIVEALVEGGADIIELGIPFSDPIADGPTIQAASARSLKSGTTPQTVFSLVSKIKAKYSIPIVLLTYYNPVFKMGLKNFFADAKDSGVDGTIVPDLPIEEAGDYITIARDHEINTIFLASPSTPRDRLLKILNYTSGFLYLVSVFGVTGVREEISDSTVELLRSFLHYTKGRIPLAVGFGISNPAQIETIIRNGAEGAIVGSSLVNIVQKNLDNIDKIVEELKDRTCRLKAATRIS
ncbi:MAG: tryptophan synthase alpha chain [Thermoproteota archaeon]|nr:tryptophan synthase alpha chain [Thermoproteota archaeon]